MRIITCSNEAEYLMALNDITEGDCLSVTSIADIATESAELMSNLLLIEERGADFVSIGDRIDTRSESSSVFALCRAFAALDAANREKGKSKNKADDEKSNKGRKPILIDENLFESVVALWQNGKISARQAMAELDLKPNTFYRRIKEREEQKKKELKKVEQEIKSELKHAAKQSKKELDKLKKQVKSEAKNVKKATDEKIEVHSVKKEIRRSRSRAESEYEDNIKQMKKDVEAEARELKKIAAAKAEKEKESK